MASTLSEAPSKYILFSRTHSERIDISQLKKTMTSLHSCMPSSVKLQSSTPIPGTTDANRRQRALSVRWQRGIAWFVIHVRTYSLTVWEANWSTQNIYWLTVDPLLMNSFNNVNLAAACLLTSTEHARKLGIPETQWVYPLGGAGTRDGLKCMYNICLISNLWRGQNRADPN